MADQTQTLKGLSESIAEHVAGKLKLNPSASLDNSILKELQTISSLLGNAINKSPSTTAKQYKLPDMFKVKEDAEKKQQTDSLKNSAGDSTKATEDGSGTTSSKDSKPEQSFLERLKEQFQSNNKQMVYGLFSKLIPNVNKAVSTDTVNEKAPAITETVMKKAEEHINKTKKLTADTLASVKEKKAKLSSNKAEDKNEVTESSSSKDSKPEQSFLERLKERFQSNNRQMVSGLFSKLIPESIKSKITGSASDQQTTGTVATKSLLESKTETQKVRVENFKELAEIIPAAFKDYFKEINTNLKDIAKLLGSIEKKDFGGDGGGGGGGLLGDALRFLPGRKGKGARGRNTRARNKKATQLKKQRAAYKAGKGPKPTLAKPTQAKPSLITKGKGAITGAAKGLGTIGTKVLKATGIIAAGATIAKAADTAFTGAKDLGSKAVGVVKEKAGAALEGAKDLGSKAISSVKEKAPAIIKGITQKAGAALEGAKDLGSKAMGAAGKAGTWVKGLLPGKAGGAIAEKVAESGAGKSVATKIATSLAKRIPKAMAGGIAKSIPFLGAAIGAGFAISRLVQGDYVGAALEGVSGLGSAATAIPATVALMAKDVYQDVYGVAPENDPEAKTRMAEITDQTTKSATDFLKGTPEAKEKTEEKPKSAEATPPITPTPVKDAVADQTIKTKETPATPNTASIPLEKPQQKFTPIAMDKVPEIAKKTVSAAVEPPKATEPTKEPINILGALSGPDKTVNKEIAESPEYKAALKAHEKLQVLKLEVQDQIKASKDTPSAQIAPAPETAPSAKPTEETAPKGDKHLETIASNTNKTNDTLAGLTSGFASLAKALEKLGVSVASNPPTTINNIAGGGQQASQGPSPTALANAGNQDISNFRRSIVEASRFQAA